MSIHPTDAKTTILGRLLSPAGALEDVVLHVGAGRIQAITPANLDGADPARAHGLAEHGGPGCLIAPGFVDLHVHGGGGADAIDATPAAIATIAATHARHGTGKLCLSVLAAPPEAMLRAVSAIAQGVGRRPGSAEVLGAHLEGPFLNPTFAGAQPRDQLRPPDPVLMAELLAAGCGAVRVVTLAPELAGALPLVEQLVDAGVVAAMGHSDATYAQARAAIDAGCRLLTHTFNGMRGLHHREPGLIAAALEDPRVVLELIADGLHVSGPMLALVARLKGPRGVALVTDCTAALDALADQARLGTQPVTALDGAVRLLDGTLAGSCLSMERAVETYAKLAAVPLYEALDAATHVPARLMASSVEAARTTRLCVGDPADLVVLNAAGRLVNVFLPG